MSGAAGVPYAVEPLVTNQAWRCNGYPVRKMLRLREEDMMATYALMAGSGAKESGFMRWVYQRGIWVLIAEAFNAAA